MGEYARLTCSPVVQLYCNTKNQLQLYLLSNLQDGDSRRGMPAASVVSTAADTDRVRLTSLCAVEDRKCIQETH
jgi:hypothetical protein